LEPLLVGLANKMANLIFKVWDCLWTDKTDSADCAFSVP
jgi:hypothetical protein